MHLPYRSHTPTLEKAAATPVRKRPSLDFSVTGLVSCTMMMFMGIAAINSQANLLFGVFGLMIGILLISGIISKLVLRKLTVVRHLPEYAIVGEVLPVGYEFVNDKRFWPSLSVSMSELRSSEAFLKQPHAYLLHCAGGASAEVTIELIPKRRGLHSLQRYQIGTSFPFGFIKRAIDLVRSDTLVVYPALAKVDPKLLKQFRSAESTGAMMRPQRGGADEFYGVKEYRVGESPRMIYWRRLSALLGVLVSKEMTRVSPPRILLMIDTMLKARTEEEHVNVERAIAMAASVANLALESGLLVGLVVWSGEYVTLPPNRGKRHRRDLLNVLARLPMNIEHDSRELMDAASAQMKSGTSPVLISPRDIQLTLGDKSRGSLVPLCSTSPKNFPAVFQVSTSVSTLHDVCRRISSRIWKQ